MLWYTQHIYGMVDWIIMASEISVNELLITEIRHRTGQLSSPSSSITLNSSGLVFRNNLPYFVATRFGAGDQGGDGFMTFPTILANRGNMYGGSSFVTAPAAGLYAFWCKTLTPSDSQIVDLRWYVNGATSNNYGSGYSGNVGGHKTMEAFAIFELNQNDTVGVYNINSGTRCCEHHNTFMGYLIGGK